MWLMPWFKVDDSIHSHPKSHTAGLAAMGLWVVSGSHSAAYLSDGFISRRAVQKLAGKDTLKLASRLVDAGLWYPDERDGETGWSFHDWEQYQPTKAQVEQARKQARIRQKSRRDSTRDSRRDFARSHAPPPPPHPPHPRGGPAPAPAREAAAGAATSADGARGASIYQQIANCDLCDDDGRKPNGMVCDHIDRRFTAAHGSKQVHKQMGWKT